MSNYLTCSLQQLMYELCCISSKNQQFNYLSVLWMHNQFPLTSSPSSMIGQILVFSELVLLNCLPLFWSRGFVPSNMVWTAYLLIPLECFVEGVAPWVVLIAIWFVKLVSSICTSFILSIVGIEKCRFIFRIIFATIVWSDIWPVMVFCHGSLATIVWSDLSLVSSGQLVLSCALLQVSAVVYCSTELRSKIWKKKVFPRLYHRKMCTTIYPATRRKIIE